MEPETKNSPTAVRPLAASLVVLTGIWRLVPHPPNLTPVGALGIYGGARLRSWQAFVLPLVVMAVTDVILQRWLGYPPFNRFVYGSLLVNVLLGRLLRNTESPWRIGAVSVVGSVQFFLVTNFGVWAMSTFYPHTLPGLLECYAAGLVFFQREAPLGFFANSLLGDLAFSSLAFGMHALLARTVFRREQVGVPGIAR